MDFFIKLDAFYIGASFMEKNNISFFSIKTTKIIESFLLILVFITGLVSCSNFLDGKDLIAELEKKIEYENSESFQVYVTSTAGTGSYKRGGGDKICKVSDELEVEFEVLPGYKFIEWKVLSDKGEDLSDYVTLEPANSLKTKITFLKACTMYITPECSLNPAIAEYEPKYNWLGVACDTPIEVTFNTLIDFKTLNSSNISIKNKNDATDYTKYFSFASIEDEGVTKLTIKPDNSIKELFKDKNEQIDLTVSFIKENINIKQNENVNLMGTADWNYRINSGVEAILPYINEVALYKKGPDENGKFDDKYKLSSLNFDYWTMDEVINNHVREIYLYISGYDADSGLDYVSLEGELVKSVEGEDVLMTPYEDRLGKKEDFKLSEIPAEDGSYYYEYYTKISFTEQFIDDVIKDNLILNDGLIKYDVSLVDRAGNNSKKHTFYIIKDTSIAAKIVTSTNSLNTDANMELDNITDSSRKSENGIDTIKLFFAGIDLPWLNSLYDPYFVSEEIPQPPILLNPDDPEYEWEFEERDGEYKDKLKVLDVKWGYDLSYSEKIEKVTVFGEAGIVLPEDSVQYIIKRDENREIYISILVEDSVGNQLTREIAVPEKARVTDIKTNDAEELPDVIYTVDCKDFFEHCALVPNNICIGTQLISEDFKYIEYGNNQYGLTMDGFNGISIREATSEDGTLFTPYYLKIVNKYEFDRWEIFGTTTGIITLNEGFSGVQDKFIPQKVVNIEASTPKKNEGFIIVKAEVSECEINPEYEYVIGYKEAGSDKYDYTASKEFSLVTGKKYTFMPFVSKNGQYICHSEAVELNKDFSGKEYDNKVPVLAYSPYEKDYYLSSMPNYVELYPFTDESGLYEKAGNIEMEYWFIPNPTLDSEKISCSEEFLRTYKENPDILKIKKSEYPKLVYDESQNVDKNRSKQLIIPMDDLPEFSYTLFVKVMDASDNNNYVIYSNHASNVINREDGYQFTYDKDKDSFAISFDKGLTSGLSFSYNTLFFSLLDDNKWSYNDSKSIDEDATKTIYYNESDFYWHELLVDLETMELRLDEDRSIFSELYNDSKNKFMRISVRQGQYNNEICGGYLKTSYVYPDYYRLKGNANPIVCKNKGILSLENGVQIFADNPVLVHTFYCSTNYGEDDDMWINHGMETGIISDDSSFTYLSDYIKDIPEGMFYKTIVHFADGTQLSTKVKMQ